MRMVTQFMSDRDFVHVSIASFLRVFDVPEYMLRQTRLDWSVGIEREAEGLHGFIIVGIRFQPATNGCSEIEQPSLKCIEKLIYKIIHRRDTGCLVILTRNPKKQRAPEPLLHTMVAVIPLRQWFHETFAPMALDACP